MSERRREERSWRAQERQEDPAESPLDELRRELQRRRELARQHRALTRDYLNRL